MSPLPKEKDHNVWVRRQGTALISLETERAAVSFDSTGETFFILDAILDYLLISLGAQACRSQFDHNPREKRMYSTILALQAPEDLGRLRRGMHVAPGCVLPNLPWWSAQSTSWWRWRGEYLRLLNAAREITELGL